MHVFIMQAIQQSHFHLFQISPVATKRYKNYIVTVLKICFNLFYFIMSLLNWVEGICQIPFPSQNVSSSTILLFYYQLKIIFNLQPRNLDIFNILPKLLSYQDPTGNRSPG